MYDELFTYNYKKNIYINHIISFSFFLLKKQEFCNVVYSILKYLGCYLYSQQSVFLEQPMFSSRPLLNWKVCKKDKHTITIKNAIPK